VTKKIPHYSQGCLEKLKVHVASLFACGLLVLSIITLWTRWRGYCDYSWQTYKINGLWN